jgi:hypothetical protein
MHIGPFTADKLMTGKGALEHPTTTTTESKKTGTLNTLFMKLLSRHRQGL